MVRENTNTYNLKWANEMKITLLWIEEYEWNKGTGLINRMKEAWMNEYKAIPMSTQIFGDNAGRF